MKTILRILGLAGGLLMSLHSSAQDGKAAVTTKLDVPAVQIGDRARLFLEVLQPEGQKIAWAQYPDTFNSLEIVERGPIDTIRSGGQTLYKQRLLITGFDSGLFTIPSFSFAAIPAGGGVADTLYTDPQELSVSTVPVDTSKPFRPIKDIIVVRASPLEYLPWVALGLAIAGAIVGLIIYLRKRGKKPVVAAPVAPLSLRDATLLQLTNLEQKQLWQRGQAKQYHIELTDILRAFIEARYSLQAPEQTTDELLAIAQRHHSLARQSSELGVILRTADLAKFAKAQPLPAEHLLSMELARKIVSETDPMPTVAATNIPAANGTMTKLPDAL